MAGGQRSSVTPLTSVTPGSGLTPLPNTKLAKAWKCANSTTAWTSSARDQLCSPVFTRAWETECKIDHIWCRKDFNNYNEQYNIDEDSSLRHCICVNIYVIWWWAFGSRSAFKVTPEVFSWDQDLSFCRPVKFFHTDWIIISLWSVSYTQRHCHVRVEKGPVQTVAIKLEAHNSIEYHYMLKY